MCLTLSMYNITKDLLLYEKYVTCSDLWIYSEYRVLRKIYQNTGFLWPVFFRIRLESIILFLHGKTRVRENPYSYLFYEVSYSKQQFFKVSTWIP